MCSESVHCMYNFIMRMFVLKNGWWNPNINSLKLLLMCSSQQLTHQTWSVLRLIIPIKILTVSVENVRDSRGRGRRLFFGIVEFRWNQWLAKAVACSPHPNVDNSFIVAVGFYLPSFYVYIFFARILFIRSDYDDFNGRYGRDVKV